MNVIEYYDHLINENNDPLPMQNHMDKWDYTFEKKFDIIYSSLTLMHIEGKQAFVTKVAGLCRGKQEG